MIFIACCGSFYLKAKVTTYKPFLSAHLSQVYTFRFGKVRTFILVKLCTFRHFEVLSFKFVKLCT